MSQLTEDERHEFAVATGERARAEMAEVIEQILAIAARVDPYHALGVLGCYALMRFPGGSQTRAETASAVQQSHMEYLQAIFLRALPLDDAPVADVDDIQLLFDLLPRLFAAQQIARMPTREQVGTVETPEQGALRLVQEYLRSHTSTVRNWGYFNAVTRISTELLAGIDTQFKAAFRMSATETTKLFEHMIRRHEHQVTAHWNRLQDVFAIPTVDEMVDAFFVQFPFEGEVEDRIDMLKREALTTERLKYALMPLADRFLTAAMFFSSDQVANETGLDANAVEALFRRLSLAPGALAASSAEQLFLDNPVWLRPLIAFPNGEFFSALPQTLMSFVYSIIDELVKPHVALSQRLSEVRAEYLEAEAERMLRAAFPQSQVVSQYRWRHDGKEYETDLILRFDSVLLLVEAKSGKVSWPALRGAPSRLVEHVRNLIVAPSEQSGRLAETLRGEIDRRQSGQAAQLDFPLSLEDVTVVLRLSVCLHDFATVQSVPMLLAQAGVLDNHYPLAPCISLADLDVMLDILEEPHVRMHYIRQRASSLLTQHVMGDELDMIGLYLDTSLNFGDLPQGEQRIFLSGYSGRLDRYYTARDEGQYARKPRRATISWVNRLCDQISRRPLMGWSELTTALLSLAPPTQRDLERSVQKIARRIRDEKPLRNQEDTVVFLGPPWVTTALAVRVRNPRLAGRASDGLEAFASMVFEHEHLERCCVIFVNALSPELPYLGGALLTRTDRPVPATIFF
ncbi:MAG: hypothetical protein KF800_07880 [Lysobacter sp.]|nr:hypothetical protein [Lysobacter sp.]